MECGVSGNEERVLVSQSSLPACVVRAILAHSLPPKPATHVPCRSA
jgi:hypothetical protein